MAVSWFRTTKATLNVNEVQYLHCCKTVVSERTSWTLVTHLKDTKTEYLISLKCTILVCTTS